MSKSTITEVISLAIPVFRNAESLKELHQRIVHTLQSNFSSINYEIVFVDDGSDDNSLEVLLNIKNTDPNVTVIKLSRNFGQFAANNAAFNHVKGDIIINMSADLQDPPELIAPMIDKIKEGYEIVLAVREKTSETFFKKITSKIHYKLVRISVPSYPSGGFDFWATSKKAFNSFMSFNDVIRRNQIDLLSIGYNTTTIPYEKLKRKHGKSQYNFWMRLNISFSQILASAFWPLRMASTLGILFTLLGFTYAVYLLITYFINDTPFRGWTPIMLLLLIIGGIIMLMLGIIGEYLWRIYFETKKRPLYFIESIYNSESESES